jgi:AAA family ATP:ADP antiporter
MLQKGALKNMEKSVQEFSNIRSKLWPIHSYELKKFIPLSILFFLISLNYSLLRNLKDIFVLDSINAAALAYIKTGGVTPMVIIYTLIYNSLNGRLGRHKLFIGVLSYFTIFFALFAFVLYPNADSLRLDGFYSLAVGLFPRFIGLWGAIQYWFFSLFYIHAELWGTFGISVVLWTFINEITSVKQSKRFYSFLALGANIALLFAATFLQMFRSNMIVLMYIVLLSSVLAIAIYIWFSSLIAKNPELYEIEPKKAKVKVKMTFMQSMKFLFGSRYLRLISTLVFVYGFVINLIEAVWKNQVKALQLQSEGGKEFLAMVYSNEVYLIGAVSILSILFFSSSVMKKGWRVGALVTPLIAAVFGALFFAFMLFGRELTFLQSAFGVSSLVLAVVFGMLQVVFIKAFKYTFFDPTKEASYIPLDEKSKVEGKAAVDGVGGRLGKSGGSFLLASFLIPVIGGGQIDAATPYIAVIIGIAIFIWIRAVISLDHEFKKATEAKE